MDREIEDLAAVIEAAGGSAYVYGSSSGAALALRAAAAGVAIEKLVAFEPPFVVDDSRKPVPATWVEDLEARGPADAVKYFMTKVIGLPGPFVAMMRLMPAWKHLKAMAPTLPYDARVVGGNVAGRPLDAAQWAGDREPGAGGQRRQEPGLDEDRRCGRWRTPYRVRSTMRCRVRTT